MQGKLALIFPGQGCQKVGMGADCYQAFVESREVFAHADEILGFSLSKLCFEGPEEQLFDTANAQPAIYTATCAMWKALEPRFADALPQVAFCAGHSLGEFSALAAAGAMSFEDGLRLVRCRGEAMRDAGAQAPGGMAALIGLDDATVAEVVAETNGDQDQVWVANYNSPGQVVIAGERAALERASTLATARGAKRAVPLAVSVACHTPLMGAASERLAAALNETTFHRPWAPIISNVLAAPVQEPEEIRAALLRQLTSPVRWVESVQAMARQGITAMIEIGPGTVLSSLVKRIERALEVTSFTDAASIQGFGGGV